MGKYPLFVRHTLKPQKQGGASWRLVLFYPKLPCDAAVYAQQGALSPDDTVFNKLHVSVTQYNGCANRRRDIFPMQLHETCLE